MGVLRGIAGLWKRFRSMRPRYQWIIGGLLLILIIAAVVLGSGKPASTSSSYERTVTLATVASLSGGGSGGNVIGTVRSVTEAKLLAQNGGTVRRVNTQVGSSVGAGSVLAELENASERAAVLQAEGAYDATVAANTVTTVDVTTDIRSTYASNFSAIDSAIEIHIDTFFGEPTATGPDFVINSSGSDAVYLSETRRDISDFMAAWRKNLATADSRPPESLLREMESNLSTLTTFITRLASAASGRDSGATAAQMTSLATARATISGIATDIASLRNSFEAQQTTSAAPTASEASVKQALGSLRLAQAALEKTVVRAPIAGTVNFLPIRVGDYVTSFMHVATVAQNGALEIVAFVSEDERAALEVGGKVTIDNATPGVITSIAPALDPITKQIEMHVAVEGTTETDTLVNGQSVRISIPTVVLAADTQSGTLLLPLSAVKLYADSRVVFTVDAEGRLVAQPVVIGEVRGDRIEILSGLTSETRIVTDARGLAAGEKVKISTGF